MLEAGEIEQIEDLLFDERWSEDATDFFGYHGAVAASVIGPASVSVDELFAVVTGQGPDTDGSAPEVFRQLTGRLAAAITQVLEQGETLELPEPDSGSGEDALENWCAGFMDVFLLHEDQWLNDQEETVSSLLFPIMTLSNLFDDEDFQRILKNEQEAQRLADDLPDVLTDLYLQFRA